jgi:peptidoglycan/LPS O-acetylase OafA/YrhL
MADMRGLAPPMAEAPPSTSPNPSPTRHFPLFDSMRAIAALSVLLVHIYVYAPPGPDIAPYVARLNAGVTLFFLISGFLLYRPFVWTNLNRKAAPATGPYAWRRALRIIPAYWVALIVTALWLGNTDVFGPRGLVYFSFTQIYSPSTFLGGVSAAWSIDLEVAFYVFLPLWAWLMRSLVRRRRRHGVRVEALGIVSLILVSLLYKLIVVLPEHHDSAISFAPPRYIDHFALGMGLAVASVALEGRRLPGVLRVVDRWPALPWLLAIVPFWYASTQLGIPGNHEFGTRSQQMWLHYLYALVALGLLLPVIFGDQRHGVLRRVLAWRPLLWVGLVSYAIYLYHVPVLEKLSTSSIPGDFEQATGLPPFLAWIVLALPVVLAIAAVSRYVVEKPALSLKTRLPTVRARIRADSPQPIIALVGAGLLVVAGIAGPGHGSALAFATIGGLVVAIVLVGLSQPTKPGFASGVALVALGLGATLLAIVGLARTPAFAAPPERKPSSLPGRAHLVATAADGRVSLYVNGRRVASAASRSGVGRTSPLVQLGARTRRQPWVGRMDEVALYGRGLAPGEVTAHYELGARGTKPGAYRRKIAGTDGVLAYWRLDEARSALARDTVGSSPGRYAVGAIRHAPGLISGDPDRSVLATGRFGVATAVQHGHLAATPVRSLEAWVTFKPGRPRTVIDIPGGWHLASENGGGWAVSVRNGRGRAVAATLTPKQAREFARTSNPQAAPGGGAVAILAGCAIIAAGALEIRYGPRRRRTTAPTRPIRRPRASAGR